MILSERGALNGFSKVFFFARSTALRGQGNEIEKAKQRQANMEICNTIPYICIHIHPGLASSDDPPEVVRIDAYVRHNIDALLKRA